MKRRAAIAAALAFSIGLHAFLILAGRTPKPPIDAAAARVPDRMYYVSIRFPQKDPLQDWLDALPQAGAETPRVLR